VGDENKNKTMSHVSHSVSISHLVYLPQFFNVRRGWFVGSGSGVVTSSPAAAICPLFKASYRSSWFTTVPLKPIIHHIFIF